MARAKKPPTKADAPTKGKRGGPRPPKAPGPPPKPPKASKPKASGVEYTIPPKGQGGPQERLFDDGTTVPELEALAQRKRAERDAELSAREAGKAIDAQIQAMMEERQIAEYHARDTDPPMKLTLAKKTRVSLRNEKKVERGEESESAAKPAKAKAPKAAEPAGGSAAIEEEHPNDPLRDRMCPKADTDGRWCAGHRDSLTDEQKEHALARREERRALLQ